MTNEDIDPNLAEDMEIAVIIRERSALGEAAPMDDLFRQYGVPINLSGSGDLDPFKIGES